MSGALQKEMEGVTVVFCTAKPQVETRRGDTSSKHCRTTRRQRWELVPDDTRSFHLLPAAKRHLHAQGAKHPNLQKKAH